VRGGRTDVHGEGWQLLWADIENPANFVVADMGGDAAFAPEGWGATVIVLSSPNPAHYKDFLVKHKMQLLTTCWSEFEVEEAYHAVFRKEAEDWQADNARRQAEGKALAAGLPAKAVAAAIAKAEADARLQPNPLADYKERYRCFGGVPRWALDCKHSTAKLVRLFTSRLPSAKDLVELVRLKNKIDLRLDCCAALVAYEDNNFQLVRARWVSEQVGRWAVDDVLASYYSGPLTEELLGWMQLNPDKAARWLGADFKERARQREEQRNYVHANQKAPVKGLGGIITCIRDTMGSC